MHTDTCTDTHILTGMQTHIYTLTYTQTHMCLHARKRARTLTYTPTCTSHTAAPAPRVPRSPHDAPADAVCALGAVQFVDIQPNDGFGTILPLETMELDLIFQPTKAKEYRFELVCKSEINR